MHVFQSGFHGISIKSFVSLAIIKFAQPWFKTQFSAKWGRRLKLKAQKIVIETPWMNNRVHVRGGGIHPAFNIHHWKLSLCQSFLMQRMMQANVLKTFATWNELWGERAFFSLRQQSQDWTDFPRNEDHTLQKITWPWGKSAQDFVHSLFALWIVYDLLPKSLSRSGRGCVSLINSCSVISETDCL